MSILATRLSRWALLALAALAAAAALLATSAAPASADGSWECHYTIVKYGPGIEEWGEKCTWRENMPETEGTRDLDIGT